MRTSIFVLMVGGASGCGLLLLGLLGFGFFAVSSDSDVAAPAVDAPTLAPPVTAPPLEDSADSAQGGVIVSSQADADVLSVRAVQSGENTWTFHVTVAHPDTGWEDYADGWDVLLPDGTVIKPDASSPFTRLLLHPHETEQPFTRSQSGVVIPADITEVRVRAHDIIDGFGGQEVVVDLTVDSGPGFEVQRRS